MKLIRYLLSASSSAFSVVSFLEMELRIFARDHLQPTQRRVRPPVGAADGGVLEGAIGGTI